MFYDDDDDDKDAKRSTFLLGISLLSNINRQTRFTQSSAESSHLAHVRTLHFLSPSSFIPPALFQSTIKTHSLTNPFIHSKLSTIGCKLKTLKFISAAVKL